jgi:hypothetical protein
MRSDPDSKTYFHVEVNPAADSSVQKWLFMAPSSSIRDRMLEAAALL